MYLISVLVLRYEETKDMGTPIGRQTEREKKNTQGPERVYHSA